VQGHNLVIRRFYLVAHVLPGRHVVRSRLIVAIHYDKQRVYTLRFLTHAEYSKNHWKKEL
jgi:mRNA-degrading endonuclease HigB of HigAB toxin-antitoxin module